MNTKIHESVDMKKLLDGVTVEWKAIGEVFNLKNGYTPSKANTDYWTNGSIPWFRMEDIRANGRILKTAIQKVSACAVKGGVIPANSLIMSTTATLGEHALVEVDFLTNQQITSFTISSAFSGNVDVKFMFYYFFEFGRWCSENANKNGGMGIIGLAKLKQFQIPIPPLSIQKEIVRILDLTTELTTELTNRKKQYNHYRDQLLSFEDGEVEWKSLGNVAIFKRGTAITKKQTTSGKIPVVANGPQPTYYHSEINRDGETIVIARSGAYAGYVSFWNEPIFLTDAFSVHPHASLLTPKFGYYLLQNKQTEIHEMKKGAGVPHVRVKEFESYSVPIPPLAEQARIVAILDKFDTLTHSISEGLPREIELRQKQYEHYRNLLLNFPKPKEVVHV